MGVYDRDYYRDEPPRGVSLTAPKTAVATLVAINVVVFLIDLLFAQHRLSDFLGIRLDQALNPLYCWRFLTYGFAHDPRSLAHLFGNMLGLVIFGPEVEGIYGKRKFLGMYLTAVVLGGAGWTALAVLSGFRGPGVIGASGAVVATILLFIIHFPHRTILLFFVIPVPAWLLGILLIGGDVWGELFRQPNQIGAETAYSVHLIGAAYAWLFYKTQWEFGRFLSLGTWRTVSKTMQPKPKLRVHRPGEESRGDQSDEIADAILDKLYRDGEASLTPRERKILEDYSRRMKQKHHQQ
jgi:membrane associated rhomboid family serine protease